MSDTKSAFIWISIAAFLIFTSFAMFVGSVVIQSQFKNAIELFFMLVWLMALLLQLEYYLLKGVYNGQFISFGEMYRTVFLSSLYAFGLWIIALFIHG